MKKSRGFIPNGLLASVLVTGMGIVAIPASAQPLASTDGVASSSDVMRYAEVKLTGRPPYKRNAANKQPLEQARFARFEERPGVAKDGHRSMYHGVHGKRPPYRRN